MSSFTDDLTQLKKSLDKVKSVPAGSSDIASALSTVRSLGRVERRDASHGDTKVEKVNVC